MKKLFFLTVFSFFAFASLAQIQAGENIAVTSTTSGKVRGYIQNGIFVYKGIPYAEAGRFEAPQKPKAWSNTRSSMVYGPVAPLIDPTTSIQDEGEFVFDHDWGFTNEDCMRINVWTPGINDGKKRPVMFWIHGGGFTAGSSQELPSYNGENLAKNHDVVLVSINHRLNILGFLDLSAYGEKYKHSANNSILDLKMALEWVKENIENFGGDPNNVTIFGQSGGGAKVNTLMAMPSANGLFHKAINQSGSSRSAILSKAETQAIAKEVISELKIDPSKIDEIQKLPFEQLAAAGKKALKTVADKMKAEGKPAIGFGLSWGPSNDGEVLPYQLFSSEAFELSKNIPLMIGTTKTEFTPFLGMANFKNNMEQVDQTIKMRYKEKADAYKAAALKAYPNYKMPSDLLDIDVTFRPGAILQANEKSNLKNGAPVFMYLFSWDSPILDGKFKSVHCMEIPFAFDNIQLCQKMTGGGPEAHALAKKMSKAWVNFAKTGNPNHAGLPNWEAYTASKGSTMFFDNQCEIRYHHDKELQELVKQ